MPEGLSNWKHYSEYPLLRIELLDMIKMSSASSTTMFTVLV